MRRNLEFLLMTTFVTVTLSACGGSGGTDEDTATDSGDDTTPDIVTDTVPDTGTDMEPDSVEDPVSDTETDVEPDVVSDTGTDMEPDSVEDPVSDTETDVDLDAELDAEADAGSDAASDADADAGPGVGLAGISPALSYIWEGFTGATFPEALTVTLESISTHDVTVSMSSSAAGLVVDDVTILAGSLSAEVPVQGVTMSATPYTVTATLDATSLYADVRVVGPAETPTLVDLRPSTGTVPTDGTLDLTVVLDLPAPTGGTAVTLSLLGTGAVPATVTVPAEQLQATFQYTASSSADSVVVSATLGLVTLNSAIDVIETLPPSLVINEVDYDNVGTDNAEFVELYNAGTVPVTLDGLLVITFNGADNDEITRYTLSGILDAGAFFLLAGASVTVPGGVDSIALPDNSIQNGSPDGLALFDTASGSILDALCYEGEMTAVTITGVTGTFNLLEGTATDAVDSNSSIRSLIRFPDGSDTDNAIDDWHLTSTPTPGVANVP